MLKNQTKHRKTTSCNAPATIAFLAFAIVFSGCVGLKETPTKNPPPEHRQSLGSGQKLGLALSGGGIRSGAVSLGVLQTLQESNVLSEFDYVSTVSGGGYPVYGLLYQMVKNKSALPDLLDEKSAFIARAEAKSDFIPNWEYMAAIPLIPGYIGGAIHRQYSAAQPTYKAKIHGTFGGDFYSTVGRPPIGNVTADKIPGFPTPIFGASASLGSSLPPKKGYLYSYGDFFEISPGFSGSPNIGYFSKAFDDVQMIAAVVMSAAAIDAPQGDFQLPGFVKALNFGLGTGFSAPTQGKTNVSFFLGDGGFIENMGILPLLRRGCTDILVFDNSDDTALFDAWFEFERRLPCEYPGWTVSQRLQSPDGKAPSTCKCDHWKLPSHIWVARLKNGEKEVRVVYVKLGINSEYLESYPSEVATYATNNWSKFAGTNWIKGMPLACEGKGLSRHCPFPVEATSDQSYTPEEFRAYRLLGKWMAEQAIPHLQR